MAKNGSVLGINPQDVSKFNKALRNEPHCLDCNIGAFAQFPVGRELRPPRYFKPGEYWHIDLFGPFPPSIGGNRYCLAANDQESSFIIRVFTPGKIVKEIILPALEDLHRQIKLMSHTPKLFHFDADTVFEAKEAQQFMTKNLEVSFSYSEPGEHRHSGVIENTARFSQDGMRKSLSSAGADDKFWCYAMNNGFYIHNRVITSRFRDDPSKRYKTPLEILTGQKPDLTKIVTWGVACVSRIPNPRTLGKLVPRGRPGVTLGNAEEYNDALFVYNLKTKKVVVSKDVRVDESIYGFTGKPVD